MGLIPEKKFRRKKTEQSFRQNEYPSHEPEGLNPNSPMISIYSKRTPWRRSSSCTCPISTLEVVTLSLTDTAAATPAPCPVTVQAIMFRIAA